ncbi:MAG: hypothetical protein IJY61_01080 [Candidatus Gastranaerophilales bacterium]|nr:hypothetical protein [Candidatus Gastranaerophilales bacterium]
MTVSSIVPVNNHTGNSSTKIFDFDFLIENESELVVHHIDANGIVSILENGVDYSIAEVGNKNGSYITFPLDSSKYNVLDFKEYLSLYLDLQIKQESEFHNSSYFNLEILEWTFDYIVRILQILNRKVERCIKVEETAEVKPEQLISDLYDTRKEVQSSYESIIDLSNEVKANLDVVEEKAELTSEQLELAKNEVLLAKEEVERAKEQVKIATQKARDAASIPIGSIVALASSSKYVPEGYLLADGTEYSKSQFKDLYNNYLTGGVSTNIEETWQENTGYYYKNWNSFAYGSSKYVLVGNDGYISTSDDGVTWNSATVPGGTANKLDVAYGNGCFIATSYGSVYFLLSMDGGNTWQNTAVGNASYNKMWQKIAFGNGRFVAISLTGDAVSTTATTINWQGVLSWAGDVMNWRSLAFGNGIFVAVSDGGYVSTTVDGLIWSTPTLIHEAGFNCINFDDVNNRFIINTDDDLIISTIDGLKFETIGTIPVTGALNSNFIIGAGKAIAIQTGSGTVYETTDFNTWTSTLITDSASLGNWLLGYDDKRFFIFSNSSISTALAFSKTCYVKTITLLNTCTYAEYETEIATYGQCAKFAVDTDNLIFRVPLIKDTETDVSNNIDYDNGTEITSCPLETTPFTATSDGVLVLTLWQNGNATSYCYINGIQRTLYHDGEATNVPETYYIPLSKDDVLYWSSSRTLYNSYFYPYKEETTDKPFKSFVVVANGQTNQSLMDWSAWASSLQGRLDTSVTNITGDGKANITDMLSPDYSAGVEKVWGETYTAEVSGWLYYAIRIAITASTTIDDYTCLWIDEVPVGVGGGQKSTSSSANSGLVKIGKGSTYRTATPSSTSYDAQCIRFYPDKGVN